MKKAGAESEAAAAKTSAGFGKVPPVFAAISVATIAAGVAAVTMANQFQTMYTRLYTQAGASKAEVLASRDAMLALGTATGFTGTQIANALYHPVSTGYDLATSLKIVAASAKEAQISGASLDDTTYSLSSVMKAFGYSADQAVPTMAKLNAIVGQGDMRFQDFNLSIKNWAPTAAAMGISIESMGSALAYLTDRGMRADEASTRLTMGLSMMGTPVKQAKTLLEGMGVASDKVTASTAAMTQVLKDTGITQNQLAEDLRKPDGIYVALTHLKKAMADNGIQGTELESVLGKLFGGGKSDKAILSLWNNLDQLKTKFDAVNVAANPKNFASAWEEAQKTTKVQFDKLKASFDNFLISVGEKLLPAVNKLMAALSKVFDFVSTHKEVMIALAAVIGGILVASLTAATVAFAGFLAAGGPIVWILAGISAAAIEIVVHWQAVKKFFAETFDWMKDHVLIVVGAFGLLLGPLGLALGLAIEVALHWKTVVAWLKGAWEDLSGAAKRVAHDVSNWWNDSAEFVKRIWGDVTGKLAEIWSSITKIWDDTGGKAVGWISEQWNWLYGNLREIWNKLVELWNVTGGRLLSLISSNGDHIKSVFSTVWNAILTIVRPIWDLLVATIRLGMTVLTAVFRTGWALIQVVFQVTWGVIRAVVIAAWTAIQAMFQVGMITLKTIFQVAWDVIKMVFVTTWTAIRTVLQVAFDAIKGILQIFIDIFSGHWSKLWNDVKTTAMTIWNTISGGIKTILGTIGSNVASAAKSIWDGFRNAVTTAWGGIWSALVGLVSNIMRVFANAGQWLYDAGKAIVQGIINGVKNMAGAAWNAVTGLAKDLWHGFQQAIGIGSPSKAFHSSGVNIVQGLINGIGAMHGPAGDAMARLAKLVHGDFSAQITGTTTGFVGAGIPPSTIAALSASRNAGGGGGTTIVVNVAGTVVSETQLRDFVQKAILQSNARNSNNGLVYSRGG